MVNLTPDDIVFNVSDETLGLAIKSALSLSGRKLLSAWGLEDLDLDTVTTKTHIRAAFPKFVFGRVLREQAVFDKSYVECALDAYKQKPGHLTKLHFDTLMCAEQSGAYSYKSSYALAIKSGLGLFLVALHSAGAITLPATFNWPSARADGPDTHRRLEIGRHAASELLAFVRSLDSQSDDLPHPAFKAVGGDRKRREWFLTYATKLLLATGWHKPEDANVEDLLSIKAASCAMGGRAEMPLAFKPLLDVLNAAYGDRIRVTSTDWSEAVKRHLQNVPLKGRTTTVAKALHHLFQDGPRSDIDLLEEVLQISAAWGKPQHVKSLQSLPGLSVDLQAMSKLWMQLEELYLRKTARENYKTINAIFGWWNVYLFYYLPYWFARNPGSGLAYPSSPSLLRKSVFVSRLLPTDEERPMTFVEFLNAQAERREWTGNSHYGQLLQLQGFFQFIERYSDEMPGCEGFAQPLSPHDYPKTSSARATKKIPVPRRFFGVYLDYHEALLAHLSVVLAKAVAGELTAEDFKRISANGGVIDTYSTSDIVGFVPVLFTKTKTVPLQFIPNVLDERPRVVRGGRTIIVPHPHALHQNLVALHTGVRHNHIQWLDRERFDSLVNEDDSEFALLFVNTDKQKKEPWTPHVNFRVIELLRAQREWCDLIEEPGFHAQHFYNNNANTKWPKFAPLFAHTAKGKPHDDGKYLEVWHSVLCGLQGLMSSLPEFGRSRQLLRLLPPNHAPGDPLLAQKLREYGAQFGMGESCPLRVSTLTTPHSARVAVVSQYITFLPTDLIGKHITGQKEGVVPYYVHLDQETLEAEQVQQASRMRATAIRSAFEPVLSGAASSSTFVHADRVNSNLARSMKVNVDETIAAYGGMSITFTERSKRGVDVLREVGAANVAFNKTEVCPYDNNCPPDLIKELKGIRRCGLCPYAVRFIDHLSAVVAKKRQVTERVDELEGILSLDAKTLNAKYTPEELDLLEDERATLCEDLAGWTLSEEVLEVMRQRLASGQDSRTWTVQKPEIIERDLRRVSIKTSASEYLLARLGECLAFPMLESSQVRARFDLLRRELLAGAGRLKDAFSSAVPIDPAAECAGMLKTIVESSGLSVAQLAELLASDGHLRALPKASLRLLSVEEDV